MPFYYAIVKTYKILIKIESFNETSIICHVSANNEFNELEYFIGEKKFNFNHTNNIAEILLKHEFQFNKVMTSALKGEICIGQTIHCAFIDGFPFLNNNSYLHYIQVDRTKDLSIITKTSESLGYHKLFTDGSFHGPSGNSGIGGIIEDLQGNQTTFSYTLKKGSSNLTELLAIKKGLERLKHVDKIQVYTDSRYVIRGLVQWIHFWKLNDWQTAHGKKVKFVQVWQETDQLCNGKIIEFKWIKGHIGHKEQSFCHNLAKESAVATK